MKPNKIIRTTGIKILCMPAHYKNVLLGDFQTHTHTHIHMIELELFYYKKNIHLRPTCNMQSNKHTQSRLKAFFESNNKKKVEGVYESHSCRLVGH